VTDGYQTLRDVVDTWRVRRGALLASEPADDGGPARAAWLREFATAHNAVTRRLVAELPEESSEFWAALRELAGNAHRVIRGDTIWEQLRFWIRDWRDSFRHEGASDVWADQLRQIRGSMAPVPEKRGAGGRRMFRWGAS
jgi:hypothetical protein